MKFSTIKKIDLKELDCVSYDYRNEELFGYSSMDMELYKQKEDGSWLILKRLGNDEISEITVSPEINYDVWEDEEFYYVSFYEKYLWKVDKTDLSLKYKLWNENSNEVLDFLKDKVFSEIIKKKNFSKFLKHYTDYISFFNGKIEFKDGILIKENNKFILEKTIKEEVVL